MTKYLGVLYIKSKIHVSYPRVHSPHLKNNLKEIIS